MQTAFLAGTRVQAPSLRVQTPTHSRVRVMHVAMQCHGFVAVCRLLWCYKQHMWPDSHISLLRVHTQARTCVQVQAAKKDIHPKMYEEAKVRTECCTTTLAGQTPMHSHQRISSQLIITCR